jgi:tetratricopeptide (TPR) repeat protein
MKLIFFVLIFLTINLQEMIAQQDSKLYKRVALTLIKDGKYGEAISQLNKYITANPRLSDGYHLRAQCFEKRGEYQYAILDYRRALKLEPNNSKISADLNRAWDDYKKILYKKIEGHKREIAINPNNPVNYLEIGKSFRNLEEWLTAENWYDEYLKRDNNASADEIIRYTEINSKTKNIIKGERILKIYVERYPTDWRLWSRYGYFTLWLGKYKIAKNAFETALSFKPYFKEAEDGLDLVNNEAYLTQYRPRSFEKEYPIDKYYRLVKKNPNDKENRYNLIEELIKENRFEEASQQLAILEETDKENTKFIELKKQVDDLRTNFFANEIEKNLNIIKENPENREAVLILAKNYASTENYSEAIEILNEYLELKPNDYELRFYLAKYYSYDRNFEEAISQINQVLQDNSDSTKYHLLAGQLLTWSDVGLDEAKEHLNYVLSKEPNNLIAIITMGTLSFQNEDYENAKLYSEKALQLQPDNLEAQDLNNMIELHELRVQEEKDLELLKQADKFAINKECDKAIEYYLQYKAKRKPDLITKLNMADTYVCLEKYEDAIALYDEILEENYDPDIDITRAKVIFWAKDSVRALEEFTRLTSQYPDNLELKLYLGDSYFNNRMYDSARVVFESMLDKAPEGYYIEKRLSWLPEEPEKPGLWSNLRTISYYTFSYLLISPTGYYFSDNLNFDYYYGGFTFETSFTKFLFGGLTWTRGSAGSEYSRINFTTLKGNIYVKPFENTLIGLSIGKLQSTYYFNSPTLDALIKYENKKKKLNLSLNYNKSDGVTILYSPYLVGTRLTAQSLKFDGSYEFVSGLKLSTYYQILYAGSSYLNLGNNQIEYVGDNLGNNFQFRMGKYFYPDLIIGYEYFFSDFKYVRKYSLFYSPQDIDSHSLWSEWTFYKDMQWNAILGAKIGYVPKSDYILREAFVQASFKVYDKLVINAYAFIGSSIREEDGYNSNAFLISAFWTIL